MGYVYGSHKASFVKRTRTAVMMPIFMLCIVGVIASFLILGFWEKLFSQSPEGKVHITSC